MAGQRPSLGHPRHSPRGRDNYSVIDRYPRVPHAEAGKNLRSKFRGPVQKEFSPAPGRSLCLCLLFCGVYFTISFAAAARTSTFAAASALSAPLAMMYTLTFGSVPDGRMIKVVPPSSS